MAGRYGAKEVTGRQGESRGQKGNIIDEQGKTEVAEKESENLVVEGDVQQEGRHGGPGKRKQGDSITAGRSPAHERRCTACRRAAPRTPHFGHSFQIKRARARARSLNRLNRVITVTRCAETSSTQGLCFNVFIRLVCTVCTLLVSQHNRVKSRPETPDQTQSLTQMSAINETSADFGLVNLIGDLLLRCYHGFGELDFFGILR